MPIGIGHAHVQLLVGEHVAPEHVRHHQGVVVLVVQDVGEPGALVAHGVVVAAGAGPGRDGLVGAGHEARVGGVVG